MKQGLRRKDKNEIIEALKAGEKWHWIMVHFKVPIMTISRYRREAKLPNRYKLNQ